MPRIGLALKAFIVFYKSPLGGERSASEISEMTGVSKSYVNRLYAKVRERGFDPRRFPVVFDDAWLEDGPRSGRPTKQTEEVKQFIITRLEEDRGSREKSCAALTGELRGLGTDISASTVRRILRKADSKKPKPARNQAQRLSNIAHSAGALMTQDVATTCTQAANE